MVLDFIEILKVIFLGIVEGITEWLPISSTGHMILVDEFITLNMSEAFKEMFFVVIQLGAILGMCQVIVGTFSYLLMSAYFFYFQIIPPTLLSPTFISFSRRLFQRLSLMLSALHPGAAYDV